MVASSAEHPLFANSADFVPKNGDGQDKSRQTGTASRGEERTPGFNGSGKAAKDMTGAALAVNIPIVPR
jgi:hypothetical protein